MLMILNHVIECQYTGLIYDMLTEWQERIPPELTGFSVSFSFFLLASYMGAFYFAKQIQITRGVMNEKDKPKIQERLTAPEAPGKV